jgi:hypothetical protein
MVSIFMDTQLSFAVRTLKCSKIPSVLFQLQIDESDVTDTLKHWSQFSKIPTEKSGFKTGQGVGQETTASCLQPIQYPE